jgi:hypothetical protein
MKRATKKKTVKQEEGFGFRDKLGQGAEGAGRQVVWTTEISYSRETCNRSAVQGSAGQGGFLIVIKYFHNSNCALLSVPLALLHKSPSPRLIFWAGK